MAKERESDTIRTLDAMFKKLMAMEDYAPPAPANSDVVDVMLGNKQQKWAFERMPNVPSGPYGETTQGIGPYGDPWKEGVNITPFGQRDDRFKENIKKELVTMFSHGAGYDQAAAHMASAIAQQMQAGAESKRTNFLIDELKKKNEKAAVETTDETNYTGMPPWAEKVPKPGIAIPNGSISAPGAARTTGYGPGKPKGNYDFSVTSDKLGALGITNTAPTQKKKKKTGNPWEDQGFAEFSTLK